MLILVINCGSSSVKYELYDMEKEAPLARGLADRVSVSGGKEGTLKHKRLTDGLVHECGVEMPSHTEAVRLVLETLADPQYGVISSVSEIDAVGHRVVHGGEAFTGAVVIDDAVIRGIEDVSSLAPLHNPANLVGIRVCRELLPTVPHVAVFDTAFHATLPRHAFMYALPYDLYETMRIRRYGFHGSSHYFVARRAIALLEARGIPETQSKIVTMHLGNGCSAAAVKGGKSVDTSMGLTPAEGLVMGTRGGDVDPAILVYLQRAAGMSAGDIDTLINKKSGLLGISGKTNDMRDIEKMVADGDDRGKLAMDIYCYRAKKYIGSYAAAMGGLDAVVFTAGVGENGPMERAHICEGLEFLGIKIDEEKNRNGKGERDLSQAGMGCAVFVIPTNEELVIARNTSKLVEGAKVG